MSKIMPRNKHRMKKEGIEGRKVRALGGGDTMVGGSWWRGGSWRTYEHGHGHTCV